MDAGIFMSFRNPPPWHRPYPQFYAEQLAQIRQAEQLGFGTVWLSEHHFSEDGYSPGLIPIAAAIASTTNRIRIGTAILISTFQNPLRLAEDAAIVDIISNGRFDLGVGAGYGVAEFEGFGFDLKERIPMLRETLDIIRGSWTQDPFSYDGKFHRLKDVSLVPKPVQDPMPLWVGGQTPKAIERLARLGCHFISAGNDMEKNRYYDECLRRHDRDPAEFNIAQVRFMHLAETTEQAWAEAAEHLHYMMVLYNRWQSTGGVDETIKAAIAAMPSVEELRSGSPAAQQFMQGAGIMVGDPLAHLEDIARLVEQGRITHLAAQLHLPGMAPELTSRSMELFASEVLPQLP